MKNNFVGLAIAISVAGCAAAPENIAASYVSEVGFQNWTCDQLSEETLRLSAATANVAKQQSQARTGDAVGIILIGLPTASMTGGNGARSCAIEGRAEAVRRSDDYQGMCEYTDAARRTAEGQALEGCGQRASSKGDTQKTSGAGPAISKRSKDAEEPARKG